MPVREVICCYVCDRDPDKAPAYAARDALGRLLEQPLCELCRKTHTHTSEKPEFDVAFILDEFDRDAKTPKMEPKVEAKQKATDPCAGCKGTGVVVRRRAGYSSRDVCRNCDGKGYVERKEDAA